MFSFFKKLFGGSSASSSLMERARESAMLDSKSNHFFEPAVVYTRDGEIDEEKTYINERILEKHFGKDGIHVKKENVNEFNDQQYFDEFIDQQHRDMDEIFREQQLHDPYLNPGQDIVVDESYHGIDHGMDQAIDDGGHHHHDY